jgi:mRNA interferase RelE/StbE
MKYRVLVKQSAEKELNKLPPDIRLHVAEKILKLADNPKPVGVKTLKPPLLGCRIRIGDWRVLYTIDDRVHEILVYAVRHRREAYRR